MILNHTEENQDPRILRTHRLLVDAFEQELQEGTPLFSITVASLTQRAGITRRTFYLHYKDVADFIASLQQSMLNELQVLVGAIMQSSLDDVYVSLDAQRPCKGIVELLEYIKQNHILMEAFLSGVEHDEFSQKLTQEIKDVVHRRAKDGLYPGVPTTFFTYYVTSVVASELGMIAQWIKTGMQESSEELALILMVTAFIRPGDLYGNSLPLNPMKLGVKYLRLFNKLEEK